MKNTHDSREAWLKAGTALIRTLYGKADVIVPDAIRYSIGFPSTGRKGKRIGECWQPGASADQHYEIFIRADYSEPMAVLGILAHELIHASVPGGSGHGPVFKAAAVAVGLEGKMTSALPGEALNAKLRKISETLGPLPHGSMNFGVAGEGAPKKQTARLLKAECSDCGYTVRVTKKWVEEVGAPHCPLHGEMILA